MDVLCSYSIHLDVFGILYLNKLLVDIRPVGAGGIQARVKIAGLVADLHWNQFDTDA